MPGLRPGAVSESFKQKLDIARVLQPVEKPLLASLAQELIGIMTTRPDDGMRIGFGQRTKVQDQHLSINRRIGEVAFVESSKPIGGTAAQSQLWSAKGLQFGDDLIQRALAIVRPGTDFPPVSG